MINREPYISPFFDNENIDPEKNSTINRKASLISNATSKTAIRYTYYLICCEDTSELVYRYEKTPVNDYEFILYYEDTSKEKSNLFGTFCLVKLGKYYRALIEDTINGTSHHVNALYGNLKINTFETFDDIVFFFHYILTEIEKVPISIEMVSAAISIELNIQNKSEAAKTLFGADEWAAKKLYELADWVGSKKYKKEDYTPVVESGKRKKDVNLWDEFIKANERVLEKLVDILVPQPIQDLIQQQVKTLLEKFALAQLPPRLRSLLEKIVDKAREVATFISEVIELIKNGAKKVLYLLNAFLMGLINGLLSLIELAITIIGWAVDILIGSMLGLDADQSLTGEKYRKVRENLEMLEDVWDFVAKHLSAFFHAVKNLIASFDTAPFQKIKAYVIQKTSELTQYDVAYLCGSFVFEVIVGLILTFLTGGGAALAQAVTKLEKFAVFSKMVAREAISVVTFGIIDLWKLFKTLFLKFISAAEKGFTHFVEYLLELMTGKLDDIPINLVEEDLNAVDNFKGNNGAAAEEFFKAKNATKNALGNEVHGYEKGFKFYDAVEYPLIALPVHMRRMAKKLTYAVGKEVDNLLNPNYLKGMSEGKPIVRSSRYKGTMKVSEKWLEDRVLVSGMVYQDSKMGHIITTKTNFPKTALDTFIETKGIKRFDSNLDDIKEIYAFYKQEGHISNDMHPYIEKILKRHFNEAAKGIKYPPKSVYNPYRTGGLPGVHAEVLALNDLLWTLEKNGLTITDDVIKSIAGFNKNILQDSYMIRCGDCQLILKDVLFLEKIIKQY